MLCDMNRVEEELPASTEDIASARSVEQMAALESNSDGVESGERSTDPKIRELEKKLDEFRQLRAEDRASLMKEIQERVELRKEQTRFKELEEKKLGQETAVVGDQAQTPVPTMAGAEKAASLTVERLLMLEPKQAVLELGTMAAAGPPGLEKAVALLTKAHAVRPEKVPYLIEELQKILTGPATG